MKRQCHLCKEADKPTVCRPYVAYASPPLANLSILRRALCSSNRIRIRRTIFVCERCCAHFRMKTDE